MLSSARALGQGTVWVITIACTVAVGSVYYNQPLLTLIGATFGISAAQAATIPALTQVGYTLGMLLFLPLGDLVERRKLIVTLSSLNAAALALVAMAPDFFWLAGASLAVGLTAVIPQLLIPLATQLAPPEQRGRIVGTVMGGLLVGIVLGRVMGGEIGASLGWRSVFWLAAMLMGVLAVVLAERLPEAPAAIKLSYLALLRSLVQLVIHHPPLRKVAFLGALLFGVYSGFWTGLPFLLERPPFEFGSEMTGLFGLVGLVGATSAPLVGKLADRTAPRWVGAGAIGLLVLALLMLWRFHTNLWGLILGAALLDLGTQTGQIANKTRLYSLPPETHNRLTTIYMAAFFAGGALGSWLASLGLASG